MIYIKFNGKRILYTGDINLTNTRTVRGAQLDLGVDVSSKDIVKAVKNNNANILGLSALLTTTIPEFKNVIQELKKEGIRDKVKVIIGGASVNEKVAKDSEVDAWARTAIDGLKICKKWIGE
jgi:methanogenic corrinoid protein MtbC1